MIVQRVERHNLKYSKELFNLCFASKNLHNSANYLIRQAYFMKAKLPSAFDLIKTMPKTNPSDYYRMCGNTNQQCIKQARQNWDNYFKALKAYKQNPEKFKSEPQIPGYKDIKKGQCQVIFTKNDCRIKSDGYLYFNKKSGLLPVKTNLSNSQLCMARVKPQQSCYVIEIVYKLEIPDPTGEIAKCLSIDLGVNNFATCYNGADNESFIINGKIVKSYNQYYNKQNALLTSELSKMGLKISKRLKRLSQKRYNKIHDYMHKASKFIINYAIKHNLDTIIIGHNDGWKQESQMSKQSNQNFIYIPFNKFINMLQYKCENYGITFIETEESYTSKIDHSILEPMEHQDCYLGKRVKRGLFKQSNGKVLNADLNGAVGILRKVINESSFQKIVDRGFVTNPIRVNPLIK